MKFRYLALLSGALFLTSPFTVPAAADDTPLAQEMDELSGSLKGLRKAETYADKVKLVQQAQAALLKSFPYEPIVFKEIADPKEKAKAWADYKRLMGLTYAGLAELEHAYLEENDERASEVYRSLKGLKKEAHKKYTE